MPQSLDMLIARLDALLAELSRAEADHADVIAAAAPEHHRGAVNVVHYTTLRQQDLRDLQNDLMDIGATSLATTEAHVEAKVRAARNVLAALRGEPGPWNLDAIDRALDEGDEILEANSLALFGPLRPGRPTRIMVTLPSEAATDPGLVASFVAAGMDVARINCAHDGPTAWAAMVANVRAAARAAGRAVPVSMDLPGPKVRTGPIAAGPSIARARVTRGEDGSILAPARIWLTSATAPAAAPPPPPPAVRPTVALSVDTSWLARLSPGDVIRCRDARGAKRSFTVSDAGAEGVLAAGQRNAYLAAGTVLRCGTAKTAAGGIPPVPRRLSLQPGDALILTTDLTPVELPAAGRPARIGCTLPAAVAALAPGQSVLLDDGAIGAVVESTGRTEATLRVLHTKPGGQRLGAEKGINLPDTDLPLPALTAEDASHLPFVAAHADLVAVSFIRTAADVAHVLDRLDAIGAGSLGLLLKIETLQGFEELPALLLTAMQRRRIGVMIARGDLAVEVGFERLSEVPRQILALCEAGHVPAIWATQVLETLAKTGQPSRAEITDAAAGQRAECVMLNKGPHILDAIRALDDILARMGEVQRKSRTLLRRIRSWDGQ